MKRSKFSLSHYKLLSCNMGELIPVGMFEVLPGDSVQQTTRALVRAAPLLSPVMHPVHVRIHHWFVPYRLIWEDFEEFITGGPDGMDASVYPTVEFASHASPGTLADYLGIPLFSVPTAVSVLPFRAYNMIFNEWYRDQDLVTELVNSVASGADTTSNTLLQNIAWEKDYFTAARPWEQKGPAVTVPLGDTAPVFYDRVSPTTGRNVIADQANANASLGNISTETVNDGTADTARQLLVDLSAATGISVNDLREALALQRYQEARARFGSRYVEYLRYLGVRSSDARLQRPEYLGGGSQTIQWSEVLQTAEGTSPVGQLRGHGIGALRSNRYRRFFEEHGVVLSLMSVRPKSMYVQGLHRMWNRRTKEDFWQEELQHIGQQEVLNKELYLPHADPEGTFGYQDRYDEYRSTWSNVAGEFRTSVLDYWHLARTFASDPALNETFVKCVPTERIFASSTNHVLYVMADNSIQARRLVAQKGRSFIF